MGFLDGLKAQKYIDAARVAFNHGDDKAAIYNYERALELVPDDFEVLKNLALLYGRNLTKINRIRPLTFRAQSIAYAKRRDADLDALKLIDADAIYNVLSRAPNLVSKFWAEISREYGSWVLPSLTRRIRYGDLVSYMWRDKGRASWRFSQEKLKLPKPEEISAEDADRLLALGTVARTYLALTPKGDEATLVAVLDEGELPFVDISLWDVAWWIAYDHVNSVAQPVDFLSLLSSEELGLSRPSRTPDPILKSSALTLRSALEELMDMHNNTGRREDGNLHHLYRVYKPGHSDKQMPRFPSGLSDAWIECSEPPRSGTER